MSDRLNTLIDSIEAAITLADDAEHTAETALRNVHDAEMRWVQIAHCAIPSAEHKAVKQAQKAEYDARAIAAARRADVTIAIRAAHEECERDA